MSDNPFRRLPAVNDVLAAPALRDLAGRHAHEHLVAAVREELDELRRRLATGEAAVPDDAAVVAERAAARLGQAFRAKLVGVINATGIVLHTNLGRAPIAAEAAAAAQ